MRSVLHVARLTALAEIASGRSWWRSALLLAIAWCVSWEALLLAASPWGCGFGLFLLVYFGLTFAHDSEPGQRPADVLPVGPKAARLGEVLGMCAPPVAVLWAASVGLYGSGGLWLPRLVDATASSTISPAWLGLLVDPELLALNDEGLAVAVGPPTPWRAAATATGLVLLATPFRVFRKGGVKELWPMALASFAWTFLFTLWLWASPGETLLARTAPLLVFGVPLGTWTSTREQRPWWTPSAARAPVLVRLKYREGATAVFREVVGSAPFAGWFAGSVLAGCLSGTVWWWTMLHLFALPLVAPPWQLVAATALAGSCVAVVFLPWWFLGGLPALPPPHGGKDPRLAELVELLPVTRRKLVGNVMLGVLVAATWVWLVLSEVWSLEVDEVGAFAIVSVPMWVGHATLHAMTRRPRERFASAGLLVVSVGGLYFGVFSADWGGPRIAFAWTVAAFLVGSALALRRPR